MNELYRCPGCGKKKMLPPGNNWCGCNPTAPFRMVPQCISRTIDALFKSIEDKQRKLAHIKAIKEIK